MATERLDSTQLLDFLRRNPKVDFKALNADVVSVGTLKLRDGVDLPSGCVFRTVASFNNSWTNYGSPYYEVSYRKDVFNVVQLRGVLKSGTVGSSAFTLPPGFRPTKTLKLAVVSNDAIGLLEIASSGAVTPKSPSSNVYVSLDNISFLAEL